MAQAPMPMPSDMPPPGGGAAGGPMDDPTAGTDTGDTDAGEVVVTICKADDGSYTVYAGDEPDSGGDSADLSEDDTDAMGPAGAAPAAGGGMMGGGAGASGGQPADSIGQALKLAMDILQSDKSSEGAPGNADDQLSAGFAGSKSPTPAGLGAQKY